MRRESAGTRRSQRGANPSLLLSRHESIIRMFSGAPSMPHTDCGHRPVSASNMRAALHSPFYRHLVKAQAVHEAQQVPSLPSRASYEDEAHVWLSLYAFRLLHSAKMTLHALVSWKILVTLPHEMHARFFSSCIQNRRKRNIGKVFSKPRSM